MAITYFNNVVNLSNNGTDVLLTFPGGVLQDDYVLVFSMAIYSGNANAAKVSTAGYTQLALSDNSAGGQRRHTVYGKRMGASPDASVTVTGPTTSTGMSCVVMIFRGVDTTTPVDVTTTVANGGATAGVPDPPSITPVSNDCCIVVGGSCSITDASPGNITSYSTTVRITAGTTSQTCCAYQVLVGGAASAENPGAWPTWSTGVWAGSTVALRPQAAPPVTLTADADSYAVTGSAASFLISDNRVLPAAAGSYTVTGTAASFIATDNKVLTAAASSYAVTGSAATFNISDNKVLTAAAGAYALTGSAANFLISDNKVLPAATGAYAFTGSPASFIITNNVVLQAAAGSYTVFGNDVAFQAGGNRVLAASTGNYVITGSPANFVISDNKVLPAAGGTYTITGSAASFVIAPAPGGNVTLTAGSGVYTLTGADAAFIISGIAPPDAGGGYTGGRAGPLYRTRRLRKEKRDELEELLELVREQIVPEPPPAPPGVPTPTEFTSLLDGAQLTTPQRAIVRRAVVSDDEEDDEQAITLLLELLS